MKLSKLLPVLCALAVGSNCLTVRADDNPAQAAARAALAKQSIETSAQQPAVTKAPDTHPVMSPTNQQEAKAKAKADKLAAEAKAKQEAADLKAKKEADKKFAEQPAAAAKAAKAQAEAKTKADKAAAAAAVKEADANQRAAQSAALAAALAQSSATHAQAKADQPVAKAKKEKKLKPVTAPQPAMAVVPQPAKPVDAASYIGKDLGMKAIAAPALPIAASKEERLQALLEKYKADQISPEEYHQQRAAILAQP